MLAKAGIQGSMPRMLPLDPRFRGGDDTRCDLAATFANLRNVVLALGRDPIRGLTSG